MTQDSSLSTHLLGVPCTSASVSISRIPTTSVLSEEDKLILSSVLQSSPKSTFGIQPEVTQYQGEQLSPDIHALCSLLARIMLRRLAKNKVSE
jgi:hypothetical protein